MREEINFTFFGTDEFSVKVLETLKNEGLKPSLVVTVPDKPQGRKMILTPPPIKIWAEANGVKIIQPSSLKNLNFSEAVANQSSPKSNLIAQNATPEYFFDFFLVASYGKIIPQEILDIPARGTLNIHPSLLPLYRGPTPLETAILNGDKKTGVTIIRLDAEMDHGPILAQTEFVLDDQYNFEQLRDKTAIIGAEMLIKIIPDYLADKQEIKEQEHILATFTKKMTKEAGLIDLNENYLVNYRKFLALNPWPGTYFFQTHRGQKIRVKIKQAHLDKGELVFDLVIPEGKKEMGWKDFLKGLKQ